MPKSSSSEVVNKIPLSGGGFSIVDDQSFDFLNQWKWKNVQGYAKRSVNVGNKKSITVAMHHQILPPTSGMEIDHVDGDKLNNTRMNLRYCTPSQNRTNLQKKNGAKASKYKGVYKAHKKWAACVRPGYKSIHLGVYETEKEAALAYNNAAKKYFGEYAKLNQV